MNKHEVIVRGALSMYALALQLTLRNNPKALLKARAKAIVAHDRYLIRVSK